MKKNIYIKPIALLDDLEVEHLLTPSREVIVTNPVAPDNNEQYGGGLGGQTPGSTPPPEEAKRNNIWFILDE